MNSRINGATLGLLACSLPLLIAQEDCEGTKTFYELEMRDGAKLATELYAVDEPAPTIIMRTPYGRWTNIGFCDIYNDANFNCVSQDLRGTGDSEGFFLSPFDDAWGENQDGYDTVEWAAAGEWSTGGVCMSGYSALAIASLAAVGAVPPSLKCAYSYEGTGDIYHHAAYQGGAFRESLVVQWLNDVFSPETIDVVMDSPEEDDPLWANVYLPDRHHLVNVPVYHFGGWYDIFSQGTIDAYVGLQSEGGEGARGYQKMLVGPWTHDTVVIGELEYPDSARPSWEDLEWFDRWLGGVENGIEDEPAVAYYLMGDGDLGDDSQGNFWVETEQWPPESVSTSYYLQPDGGMSLLAPSVENSSDSYVFNPSNPVPTLGGNNLELEAGPFDQSAQLAREDILEFQTQPLTEAVAIGGRISATLFVASSALDTDFTVKLMDVYPDGRHMSVLDGILRMRYRDGQDHAVFMEAGDIYEVEVDLWSTALVFEEGHSIAVAISSSNFPRFDVNTNTGGVLPGGDGSVTATQTLYHDSAHPSALVLPVMEIPERAN